MREIKFRAWDKDNFEMLTYDDIGDVHFGLENDGSISLFIIDSEESPNVEIMQFTGLHDNNGAEIYEGDIVKSTALLNDHNQRGAITKSVVRYWMGNACLCSPNGETGVPIYPLNVTSVLEVVGNIHQNPELLDGGL